MTNIYAPSTPPTPSPFTQTKEHLDLNCHTKEECLEVAPYKKSTIVNLEAIQSSQI